MVDSTPPKIGDPIVFIDENRNLHAAVVARVYANEERALTGRPRIALAWLGYDGVWRRVTHAEPARHDGERWIVLFKWAFPDEVPEQEFLREPAI